MHRSRWLPALCSVQPAWLICWLYNYINNKESRYWKFLYRTNFIIGEYIEFINLVLFPSHGILESEVFKQDKTSKCKSSKLKKTERADILTMVSNNDWPRFWVAIKTSRYYGTWVFSDGFKRVKISQWLSVTFRFLINIIYIKN